MHCILWFTDKDTKKDKIIILQQTKQAIPFSNYIYNTELIA